MFFMSLFLLSVGYEKSSKEKVPSHQTDRYRRQQDVQKSHHVSREIWRQVGHIQSINST